MDNKYKKHLLFSLLLLSVMSFIRYFNSLDSRLIDLVSHFPVQYALAAFVLLMICLWKKIVSLAVLAGLLFVINAGVLMSSGESISAAVNSGMHFKVYSTNLNIYNKDISRLKDELQRINADVVMLLEVSPLHDNDLKLITKNFPYHVKQLSIGRLELGMALLSKFPILDHNIKILSEAGNAIFEATLEINKRKILFYGTHLQNPVYTKDFSDRNQQVLELARQISRTSMPVIVAGDFNATPFSPIFRQLIKTSGLKDSREGFGWQPSWPTYMPLLGLSIDHILVSPEIHVHNRGTGSFIGSDHYPVIAELSIN